MKELSGTDGDAVALIGATPLAMEVTEQTGLHDERGQPHRRNDRHRQDTRYFEKPPVQQRHQTADTTGRK
jgi:hypothetical protein